MRKDPGDIVADLAKKLDAHLPAYAAGAVAWNASFPVGDWNKATLEANFGKVPLRVDAWRQWAREHGIVLAFESRMVKGTAQQIVTHAVVPDVDTAARLAGGSWPAGLARARYRAGVLAGRFAHLADPATLAIALNAVMDLSDVDFALACAGGAWFADEGDTSHLTPRQVPLEGTHAKWLQSHRRPLALLAGRPIVLAPGHPSRVHFTYLDPGHLADGRKHDVHNVGDVPALPYRPRVVLVCENKDTAVNFPRVPGGVAVEGAGSAAGVLAQVPWLVGADVVVYWGDIDADGLTILDQLRTAGVPALSMLMDAGTYARYERYGTNTDKHGKPLGPRPVEERRALGDGERKMYELLCSAAHTGPRRVEQERIPLQVAAVALETAVAQARAVAASSPFGLGEIAG